MLSDEMLRERPSENHAERSTDHLSEFLHNWHTYAPLLVDIACGTVWPKSPLFWRNVNQKVQQPIGAKFQGKNNTCLNYSCTQNNEPNEMVFLGTTVCSQNRRNLVTKLLKFVSSLWEKNCNLSSKTNAR